MYLSNAQRYLFLLTTLLVCGLGIHHRAALANPSNKDFDAGVAVHGKGLAATLAKEAQGLYETSNAATLKFAEAAKAGKVDRLSWKSLGQNDVRLDQLRRVARQLELLGETAGVDYRLRADSLFKTTGDIINAFRATPSAQKQMDQVRLLITKQAPIRAREIEKLTKMAGDGKWEAAETEMYRFLDQLGVATTCLFNPEKQPIYSPFSQVKSAIDDAMRRARHAQAQQSLTERRQAETPDFAGMLRDVESAITSLAATGTVDVDGASISGPEAITAFGERWGEIQVRAIRCRTLDWLLGNSMEAYAGAAVDPTPSKIVAEFASFNNEMSKALRRLIEADASRVNGADAAKLYVAYLKTCAPLIRRSVNQSLAPTLNPALQSLANRAPQFPVEIASYTEGTADLLRWRARVARNQALARAEAYPSIDSLMFSATQSDADYQGLYPEQGANPKVASLLTSAPQAMSRPLERLQGKPAHALDVVRLGETGPVAIARYRVRSYANIPAPLDLAAEIDALKFDLMVSDELPALSMLAAVAIDSAQRGDLASVGGTIANQYLESLTTRFAALPTAASILTPLGSIPVEQAQSGYRNQMLMRFDLKPTWAQHDFFFVEFAAPATSAE